MFLPTLINLITNELQGQTKSQSYLYLSYCLAFANAQIIILQTLQSQTPMSVFCFLLTRGHSRLITTDYCSNVFPSLLLTSDNVTLCGMISPLKIISNKNLLMASASLCHHLVISIT